MRICIDHYRCSNEIIYVIHDNLTYYRTDFAISKFLGLDKKEYKKKIKENRSSYYRLHGRNLFKANYVR